MKNTKVFWSLCLWVACLGLQCKPEPPDEPNPCLQQNPTTAAFSIHESSWTQPDHWPAYDTDTLVTNGATFTAQESGPGVKYEWILGAETLHVRSFYRTDFPINQPIPIRLKVSKTPNWNCFPTDDGVDEKARTFIIKIERNNSLYSSRVYGSYRGVNSDKPYDTITVQIDTCKTPGSLQGEAEIKGLTGNCSIVYDDHFSPGYRQLYFGVNSYFDCYSPRGFARVYGPGYTHIIIQYDKQTLPGGPYFNQRVAQTFTGTRVQ